MSMRLFSLMWVGVIFLFAGPVEAANTCDVARDVAEKAALAYKKDKKRGVDLFMKAYRLCPKDGAFAYNLGMAWNGYGKPAQAQKYLEMAVKKDGSRALWQNNLASVMIKRGVNMKGALSHAKKGAALDPNTPEFLETLANAHMINGDFPNAVEVSKKAAERWPDNQRVVAFYDKILNGYLKENQVAEAMDVDTDIPRGTIKRPYGVAVVIGNQRYEAEKKGLSDVKYAERDASAVRRYRVSVDAAADYIANNGYSLALFYRILSKLPAKDVTVVLDACFSGYSAAGPLFKNISPGMLKSKLPVRKMANGSVFCGAGKDQVCTWYPEKRHSLFTYFFLKGLGGKADKNGDKTITTGEMKTYLEDEVPYRALREANRKQNPLVTGDENAVLTRLE